MVEGVVSTVRRARLVVPALLLLLAASAAACSSSPPPREARRGGPSTTAGCDGCDATTTSRPAPARIRLNFAGDVNFEGPRAQLLRTGPAQILGPIARVLGDADLTVVNLETAITERGTPAPKAFTFRTNASALDALRAGGVDVASVANNHGLDYGPVGVEDALAASQAKGFPLIGIGRDEAQAMAPYRATIRGHRVAVIGATQVLDDELMGEWTATPDHAGLASAKRVDSLVAAVRSARPEADTLVVFLHWGIERNDCPSGVQQTLARQLVDAGADVVVGGHAHRLQGAGRLNGSVVHYGLGNFAFYAGSESAAATGVFTVEVGGGQPPAYEWHPARIDGNGIPHLLSGQAADTARTTFDQLRPCTGLTP